MTLKESNTMQRGDDNVGYHTATKGNLTHPQGLRCNSNTKQDRDHTRFWTNRKNATRKQRNEERGGDYGQNTYHRLRDKREQRVRDTQKRNGRFRRTNDTMHLQKRAQPSRCEIMALQQNNTARDRQCGLSHRNKGELKHKDYGATTTNKGTGQPCTRTNRRNTARMQRNKEEVTQTDTTTGECNAKVQKQRTRRRFDYGRKTHAHIQQITK